MAKIIKDDLNYIIFNELYLRFDDPGAKRKAFNILESAILCLERKGFGNITVEMVAREAAVTRPMIKYYFEDLNELSIIAIKYIRLRFQKSVLESVLEQKTPTAMLGRYVEACFHWIDSARTHANVWLSFLSQCSRRPTFREVNTTAVSAGEERIKKLLLNGQMAGEFNFEDIDNAAKSIQVLITGAMVTYVSDTAWDANRLKKIMQNECFQIVGAKPATPNKSAGSS